MGNGGGEFGGSAGFEDAEGARCLGKERGKDAGGLLGMQERGKDDDEQGEVRSAPDVGEEAFPVLSGRL